ncbi:hypothetical protein PPL_06271 [Heterostelium album PN500]|uniref:Uncharacterized protein n=1 Tax=Heterostelium pallidum (strain ATCC 26659 / Pp 5 / PN500) TaxID=670386 RepID=D3BCP5_HETP5|nr:hypothetical protein PPL_06271 [Heterostelium album PN500]EFA80687.1 hypothetical protein PPL_06271 [Heterostelium album PN500]|eukprot:XP_020432807.1 hypothetical protein PPL_06271 [Heterostelium album PN500]
MLLSDCETAKTTTTIQKTLTNANKISTTSIIESINQCKSLVSFIESNNDTIFNQYSMDMNDYNIKDIILQYNNDIDSILLDSIYKFNNKNQSSSSSKVKAKHYRFDMKTELSKLSFGVFEEYIKSAIHLQVLPRSNLKLVYKHTYIFSTHQENGATLFDISNNTTEPTEIFQLKTPLFDFNSAYVVQAGDIIYSTNRSRQLFTFSLITHEMNIITHRDLENLDIYYSSLCYDGEKHIHLICSNRSIYQLNIATQQIKQCYHKPQKRKIHYDTDEDDDPIPLLSFWYKGLLYCFSASNIMLIYNPTSKKMQEYNMCEHELNCNSICTDGNGNVFIQTSKSTFHQFNLDSKQMVNLNSDGLSNHCYSSVYHKHSRDHSYVYMLCGDAYGNLRYSIENDQWENVDNKKIKNN